MNEELRRLEQDLVQARETYYHPDGDSTLSDAAYDQMEKRLLWLDPLHPLLMKVGATPRKRRVPLQHRMYSLEKAKGTGELGTWIARHGDARLISSLKMDGGALDLTYEQLPGRSSWQLVAVTTRGDGETGEDVSSQMINGHVTGIPHFLSGFE